MQQASIKSAETTAATHSRRRPFRNIAAALFGHDCFLSYSRQDATGYATRLATTLEQHSLVVCFDRTDFAPGDSLNDTLRKRVRRSYYLVLVDTPQARRSRYVADEIARARRSRRRIVRITDGTGGDVGWSFLDPDTVSHMGDVISIDEAPGAITGGELSAVVVDNIVGASRRFRTLRRLAVVVVTGACMMVALGGLAWLQNEMAASRELAANSERASGSNPAEALELAIQAGDRRNTDEARRALSRALVAYRLRLELPDSSHTTFTSFSSDGSKVVTIGKDGARRIWDARTGALLLHLAATETASSSQDPVTPVWPAESGRSLFELCRQSGARFPGFSLDCSRAITVGRTSTREWVSRVWDVRSGRRILDLPGEKAVLSGIFSLHENLVVTIGEGQVARIRNVETGASPHSLAPCPFGNMAGVAFSPDGSRLVAAGDDAVCVWDSASGLLRHQLEGHTDWVVDARFSPDGSQIVTAGKDLTARVWNADTGELIHTLTGHAAPLTHAEFSVDGLKILTSSGTEAKAEHESPIEGQLDLLDPTVRVWSSSGNPLYTIRAAEEIVHFAAFAPDGNSLVTGGDGSASIWLENARRLDTPPRESTTGNIVDPTMSSDGTLRIEGRQVLDTRDGREVSTLDPSENPLDAAFSTDGTYVLAVFPKEIRVWDVRQRRTATRKELNGIELSRARISPDRTRFVGIHNLQSATVWDERGDLIVKELNGDDATWSPDGRSILTIYQRERKAILWDAATGRRLYDLPGGANGVDDADFSPDGSQVVTADGDHVVRIWDARTGKEFDSLPSHGESVSVYFSGDGRTVRVIESGSESVYPYRFEDLLALAKARRQP